LSAGEDITERRAAEDAAREREALARIGQMAAVVAHEVRNPLAGIRGSIQILGSRLPSDGEEQEVIHTILERLDGMARMSQDLLLYSRPRVARFERLCLKELLHSTAGLLASDPEMGRIEVEVTGLDGVLDGDPELLGNVFLNLLLNAAQAMNGEGVIRIRILDGDGQWHVSVDDTGPGIPADKRARIFEPFFTTRHRGTGLGLAIAKQSVEAHRGTISLNCPQDGGTQVLVSLPQEASREPARS
jgi:signal transduction histidine kinase